MEITINDFVITVATVNGSGSQSANTILLKTLFRMGIPVSGKNVFPSNIQGLPTWFWIRASKDGYTGRRELADIVVSMNPQTVLADTKIVKPNGVFLYNSDLKFDSTLLTKELSLDVLTMAIPIKQIVDSSTNQVKAKKLLANIVYIGVLANLLELDWDILSSTLSDQFGGKESLVEMNKLTMKKGFEFAQDHLRADKFPFKSHKTDQTKGKMIIDGNSASALGLIQGGASFAAWYPITPSSSLVENFSKFAHRLRRTEDGKNKFAVLQAEDELASICMVLGASWAGARAFTATSGPGLSLMQEAIGYAYYAEIPAVIWNVQRVGPSTGMPTRTAQGDLFLSVYASHGDTKHPVLLPGNPAECYEFGQTCFDLAERLQTPVLVLSDLDLGMNLWMIDELKPMTKPYDRGKVLSAEELNKTSNYFRYQDLEGDGIPYRTLPGTKHPAAPYVTRGSGHGSKAQYTEQGNEYSEVLDRLRLKWKTAEKLIPKPIIDDQSARITVMAYGSSENAIQEARALLEANHVPSNYVRIRALPFFKEIEDFLKKSHERQGRVYLIDLNRDSQMLGLLHAELKCALTHVVSLCHYDGTPITADKIAKFILQMESKNDEHK